MQTRSVLSREDQRPEILFDLTLRELPFHEDLLFAGR
jgi:hypothetical protein